MSEESMLMLTRLMEKAKQGEVEIHSINGRKETIENIEDEYIITLTEDGKYRFLPFANLDIVYSEIQKEKQRQKNQNK